MSNEEAIEIILNKRFRAGRTSTEKEFMDALVVAIKALEKMKDQKSSDD